MKGSIFDKTGYNLIYVRIHSTKLQNEIENQNFTVSESICIVHVV